MKSNNEYAAKKPKDPPEIPVPAPEIQPTKEPESPVWPNQNPEIQPEHEPLTNPPVAPPDFNPLKHS